MKTLMNYAAMMLTAIFLIAAANVNAQEWTDDQLEVWQVVESAWENWQNGNYDATFESIHEKYMGWNHEDPLPTSKEKWIKTMEMMEGYAKLSYYDLEPARIVVYKNVAVVHYYFSQTMSFTKDGETKEYNFKGKNAEFLVKEKDLWLLIGDMTFWKSK